VRIVVGRGGESERGRGRGGAEPVYYSAFEPERG